MTSSCRSLRAAPALPALRRRAHGTPRAAAVTASARYGRRWWSDAWEDDSFGGSSAGDAFGLDGGSAPGAEQMTTLFCSDGSIVRLGPTPHPALADLERQRQGAGEAAPLPLPREQGLCIGSVFTICATNGIDAARRLNLLGFCFSTEQLFERVEDTVLRRGGEVFETRRHVKSGVHERLHMRVAIPLLFGVPPEYERLKAGVIQGGGVIERVQQSWIVVP